MPEGRGLSDQTPASLIELSTEAFAAFRINRLATLIGRMPSGNPAANAAHISICTGGRGARNGFDWPGSPGRGAAGLRGMGGSEGLGAAPGQAG